MTSENMEIWMLACTFTGTAIGAWLGAYIASRATEKGKIDQQTASIEKIVVQLQKTTLAVEQIKTDLNDQIWNQQWVKQQRLKVYSDLLLIVHRLRNAASQLNAELTVAHEGSDEVLAVQARIAAKHRALTRVYSHVCMFGTSEIRSLALEAFSTVNPLLVRRTGADGGQFAMLSRKDALELASLLDQLAPRIARQARVDFAVEPADTDQIQS